MFTELLEAAEINYSTGSIIFFFRQLKDLPGQQNAGTSP